MDAANDDAAAHLRAASRRVLAAWILLCGLGFALTSIATLRTFAWPQPAFDQFRMYPVALELPFPANVLQSENQHRPVIPALVRVAEVQLFDADQRLQIALGAGCALLTAALLALFAWRATTPSVAARAAGVTAALVAVGWLGNARMLLHGSELVAVYVLTLAVVGAGYAVWRAAHATPARWMTLGALAATVATFCFGPGIALFPALLILAWLQRVPWRAALIPVWFCIGCLVLYLVVLPGDQTVRGALELRPWETLQVAARWIASPWIHAWLGFADAPMDANNAALIARGPGRLLVESANAVQAFTGLAWAHGLALALGGAGFAALGVWLLGAARRREPMGVVGTLALMLMMFGAATALIIGIGRLDYLRQNPQQIFADRYLVWPCLFWLGLVLRMLASPRRWPRRAAIAAMAVLPVALWPTHELGAGWGATVYRGNQASAAAARSDVFDRDVFWPDDPAAPIADKLRSLQLFRERGLAMYAGTGMRMLGERWDGPIDASTDLVVAVMPAAPVTDFRDARAAARFSAEVHSGISRIAPDAPLVVIDPERRIVGYGALTYVADGRSPLRWSVPRKRGIDAYVNGFVAGHSYRLLLLDPAAGRALELGTVPP